MRPAARRVLTGLAVACGIGLLAWLAVPAWAPWLAARMAPEGWRVEALAVSRPGPRSTGIAHLEAAGSAAGAVVHLRAAGATLRYRGPLLEIERLEMAVSPSPGSDPPAAQAWSPADLSLPRLLLSGTYPAVRVGRLEIRYTGTQPPRTWTFDDIAFDGTGGGLALETTLRAPDILTQALALSLRAGAATVELRALRAGEASGGGTAPLLSYTERSRVDGGAAASLVLDLPLDLLRPAALTDLARDLAPGPLLSLAGRLGARVDFRGRERLAPVALGLDLERAALQFEGARAAADLRLEGTREGDRLAATVQRLEILLDGSVAQWTQAVDALLRQAGVTGVVADAPLHLVLGRGAAGDLNLALGLGPLQPVSLAGDLDLHWAQEGAAADLHFSGLDLRWPGAAAGGMPDLRTGISGTLSASRPLGLALDGAAASVGALDAALDLALVLAPEAAGAGVDVQGTLERVTLADVAFANPELALRVDALTVRGSAGLRGRRVDFDGSLGGSGLTMSPGEPASAGPLLRASSLAFQLGAAGEETVELRGKGAVEGLVLPDAGATLDRLDLEIPSLHLPAANGRVRLLTTGLEATAGAHTYSGLDLDVSGDLAGGRRFTGGGDLLLGYSAALPFGLALDLEAGSARVTLDAAVLPAAGLAAAGRALALPLPESLAFRDGRLVLDGAVDLGAAGAAGDFEVRGEGLALALGESVFEGLDFRTRFSLVDGLSGGGPLSLARGRLAAGLDLTALETQVDIRSVSDFGARDMRAQLLGGRLSAPALRVTGSALQDVTVRWEGVDLGRLVAFLDVSGLSASGAVDATLPVVAGEGGPAVRDGRLRALGAGRLAYRGGAPATNIGLQALENFHYESLEGTVDYSPDGAYTVALDILGENPDLYGGHPVRFRLNLGGAMPALFRSLFVTGDFDQAIVERLRTGELPVDSVPGDTGS